MYSISRIVSKVADGSMEIGYYRSHKVIKNFEINYDEKCDSPDSSLGVFFNKTHKSVTHHDMYTVINAENDNIIVYVVGIPTAKKRVIQNTQELIGINGQSDEYFSQLRRNLIKEGYDCLEINKSGDVILISLLPEKCVIIGTITSSNDN